MSKLNPETKIAGLQNITVSDFWAWAYSDILSNRNRAIFVEFIVGTILGIVDSFREEWASYDLKYKNKKIEVKSAGYTQSWHQNIYLPYASISSQNKFGILQRENIQKKKFVFLIVIFFVYLQIKKKQRIIFLIYRFGSSTLFQQTK